MNATSPFDMALKDCKQCCHCCQSRRLGFQPAKFHYRPLPPQKRWQRHLVVRRLVNAASKRGTSTGVSVCGNSVFTSRSIRMGTAQKDKQNYPAPSDYVPHNYTISKDIMMDDEKHKYHNNAKNPAYYNDHKASKPSFPRIKGKCTRSPAYYQDKYLRQNPMVKVIKCPAKNRPT